MAKKKPEQHLYIINRTVPMVVRAASEKEAIKLAKEADISDAEEAAGDKLISFELAKQVGSLKDLPKKLHDSYPAGNAKLSPEQDDEGNDIPDTESEYGDTLTCKEILTPPKAPKKKGK